MLLQIVSFSSIYSKKIAAKGENPAKVRLYGSVYEENAATYCFLAASVCTLL